MTKVRKHVDVVAAVIENNQEYLCVQRGQHKYDYLARKYEFPGGKVEKDETPEAALQREIAEELLANISVEKLIIKVSHSYPDFDVTLKAFLCHFKDEIEFTLTEHINAKWLSCMELESIEWASADIPIVNKLKESEQI